MFFNAFHLIFRNVGSFGVQRKNGRQNVTFEVGKSLDINNDIADEINGAKHLNILVC
jgi:hypothetical protein